LVLRSGRERLKIPEHNLAVIVLGHLPARAPRQLGPPSRLGQVTGQRAGPGQCLIGEGQVEIGDALALADLQDLPGMKESRFGAAKDRIDAGALPFASRAVDRLTDSHPVVGRRVGRVDHLGRWHERTARC
jgi:hypothetical protein